MGRCKFSPVNTGDYHTKKCILEGSLTTEEYTNLFHPDWESVTDILEVTMSIDAQATDLYLPASNEAMMHNLKSGKTGRSFYRG
ncbi:MAG: hypothetical protein D8M57_07925 [Candidatus Scalindua sp. AMX11]|nr:MAG: hypothetical protein DWQ00_11525 [Candidatus Scalindua sp.]NOG85299.1 hypothetical protein [Planctomycetota bacterium]RZV81484.1 MAG: hypothetical protein EX341_10205 [Candidatus Scalindua sp. SCAELEC01]TDE65443.1 MAG: hypothetical protein D8M57_07925 [Candidatus Scalindua sp. AMX11]GJQ59367.1 MAG: hypothetical protein SCALA701_21680 [Candidatus Scalindua sp.]